MKNSNCAGNAFYHSYEDVIAIEDSEIIEKFKTEHKQISDKQAYDLAAPNHVQDINGLSTSNDDRQARLAGMSPKLAAYMQKV